MNKENIFESGKSVFDIVDNPNKTTDEVSVKRIEVKANDFANKFTNKLNDGELDNEHGQDAYSLKA